MDRTEKKFEDLRRKATRWVMDNQAQLRDADPELPQALNDRAQDNWRPLFAIAAVAGGPWLNCAEEAALLLSSQDAHLLSTRVQLLADIKVVFEVSGQLA